MFILFLASPIFLFKLVMIKMRLAIALSALVCLRMAALRFISYGVICLASRELLYKACEFAIMMGVTIELATGLKPNA